MIQRSSTNRGETVGEGLIRGGNRENAKTAEGGKKVKANREKDLKECTDAEKSTIW